MQQSSIFPIYLKAEYRDGGQGFVRFETEAARAARAAKREFDGVRSAVDLAIARQRNSFGSLDLGVDEMRRAAQAQQQVAQAAREVAEATKRAALSAGTFDTSMSRATRAAFELANAEDRLSKELLEQVAALDAVQRELNQTASATDLVTAANRRNANSSGASRTAFIQLGQQLQDATVQAQLGTSAFLIFGQQVPQAAFALSGLADSANRAQARIGALATFLAGPWGAAIFAGTAILGPFVARLFDAGKAADEVRFSTDALGNAQGVLANAVDIATGRINTQSEALRNLAAAQILAGQVESARRQAELRGQLGTAATEKGARMTGPLGLPFLSVRPGPNGGTFDGFARSSSDSARIVRGFLDGNTGASQAIDQLRELEEAGKITQERLLELSATIANLGVEQRNAEIFDASERLLEGGATGQDRALLLRPERARRGGRRGGSSEARELERLANFGERAEERIARLNERFDQQPRLIDAAAQATRELDTIIADLAERKPANFEKLIEEARQAQGTIRDALARPVEDLLALSRERLQIEGLIAAGRADEATALTEILRLQAQIGDLTEAQKNDILDQIRFEQEKTRELRAQAALLDAQANVARTVANDLRDLLSGRSADLFGNLRQSLRDLQGARLFEDIFGESFRQLEQELAGNTPQGLANARYATEVEKTAASTVRLGDALDGLTSRITAANDNAISSSTGAQASVAAFVAGQLGIGLGINVNGNRGQKLEIGRLSINELANKFAQSIAGPLEKVFEDIFGPRFAGVFGDIVGGAIRGQILAGNVGSVLGGLQGLTGNIRGLEGVSGALGQAGAGAARGTEIAGLANLLGLGGSTSGAQIGGGLGGLATAVTGIPGLDIIGGLVGNFLGSLFGGTPRGSATIGNLGGSLGVTNTRGTSNSREAAAGDLAGSVLEAVERIARELGASVDAARGSVSIGVRNDDLRVDTTGRGITRTSNGAIDFGEDTEAAIAFAVQDLINDGVITGLRQAEQNLLRAGNDVEAALRDVLQFRSVFDRLREIRDPIAFAVEQIDREFRQLRDLFTRASATAADFAELDQLEAIERARAIEEATDRVAGSLRQLLADLTIGDSGLSLRSRRGNALGQFNDLAGRVAAGDSSAFDDFAEISQQLLDIERQLFGSTQSYFDRLAQVTALTETAIDGQTNVTSIAASGSSAIEDQAAITRSIGVQTDQLARRLDAINENLIAVARGLSSPANPSGGGRDFGPFPGLVANF